MARPLKKPRVLGPIGQAIVDLRTKMEASQQTFAVALGVALNTIARWEAGREPSGASLIQLHQLAIKNQQPELANIFWDAAAAELGQVGIQRVADIYSKAGNALALHYHNEPVDFPSVLQEIKGICTEINPWLQWADGQHLQEETPKPKRKK
jgi:transcriptional regulator with XRE-family HTH domain